VHHAQSIARDSGRPAMDVDLEQLPAYEPAREENENDDGPAIISPVPVRPQRNGSIAQASTGDRPPPPAVGPGELPPGYEEAQALPVNADDLDQRLRAEAQRQ
jgi:hypothetical protein